MEHLKMSVNLIQKIEQWLDTSELRSLLTLFDGPERTSSTLEEYLNKLADFSVAWDFRRGKERTSIDVQSLTPDQIQATQAAAVSLGLLGHRPPKRSQYDHVLVLGGTLLSCFLRTQYAGQFLQSKAEVGHVYLLGTRRAPAAAEWEALRANTEQTFAAATDEFEMLRLCAETLVLSTKYKYEITSPSQASGSFELRYGIEPQDFMLSVLCTEGAVNPIRATTGDTYEHWQSLALPGSSTNVLLVTSQIYAPFQEFDALRLISRSSGAIVEVVGIPPPADADPSHLLHKPENYLQEIRSAILSAQRLFLSL
jgi:hypothetical protein